MTSLASQNQELKDLRAYAEIALYYAVMRRDPDLSPRDLGDLVLVLRDLLADVAPNDAADREVALAYDAARERARRLGHHTASWQIACPWRLRDLVKALSDLAEELGMPTTAAVVRRKLPRNRKSSTRGNAAVRRRRPGGEAARAR